MWNWFKKKKKGDKIIPQVKEKVEEKKSARFLGEVSFEEWKAYLLSYYKQEWALRDNKSYFEPQDNFFGEYFDNGIRIKFLKEQYPEYFEKISNLRLLIQAKEEYDQDNARVQSDIGGDDSSDKEV